MDDDALATERARLDELAAYAVLDTAPEPEFDEIVRAAAAVAGVPTALVSLLDADRQWFKARVGMVATGTPRSAAFCDLPVRSGERLVVADARADPRFARNPLVAGPPHIRRYAGYPLRTPGGHVLGTLCVLGPEPGEPTPEQHLVLEVLADQVVRRLVLRRALADQGDEAAAEHARLVRDRLDAESRTHFTAGLLDSIDVGVVACDADGHLTLFNSAARAWHGSAPDSGSDTWAERCHLYEADGRTPLTPERIPLARALTEGVVRDASLVIVAPDQEPRLVRCDGSRLEEGGAVIVMQDVTALHRAAQDLAEARDRARAVVETATDAFVSLDAEGRVVEWNPQAEATFGWSAVEALGRPLDALVVPAAEVAAYRAGIRKYAEGRQPSRLSRLLCLDARHRDGHTLPVEVRVWRTEDSRGWRFHAFARDISERIAAEEALAVAQAEREAGVRASEERFRAAFEHGPMAIARLSLDGLVLEGNPALRRLLSRPSRHLVGTALVSHALPEDGALLARTVHGAARGPVEPIEVRLVRVDGVELWCEMATTLVAGPGDAYLLVQLADITDRKRQELALEEAARRDPLTGLLNREALTGLLADLLSTDAARRGLALLFVDLDDFKTVNDTAGHEAGDAVLVEIGRRLVDTVRPGDAVVRLGGDEFVVVCAAIAGNPQAAGDALAVRVADAVAAPVVHRGQEFRVGASVGVAVCRPGDDATTVVARADAMMYERKAGRRRAPDAPDRRGSRPPLVDLVATAVEEGRAAVHYQPVVDLRDGTVVGAEALLRLRDREGVPIPPDLAVAAAERHGYIGELGAWVLGESLRETAAWKALLPPAAAFGIGVNLSPAQLDDPRLPGRVAAALAHAGVAADALVLELTETRLTADTTEVQRILLALREVGCHLAVDDFGTGYASLGYLTTFPVSVVKIDRSFTAMFGRGGRGEDLARGLARLATTTDLITVVEGVETELQRQAVAAEGCVLGQGWLWGKAVAASELTALLSPPLPLPRGAAGTVVRT